MAVWTSGRVRFVDKVPSVDLGKASAFARRPKYAWLMIILFSDTMTRPAFLRRSRLVLSDVVAVLLKLLITTLSSNSFSVTQSDGTVLQGDVRLGWRREGLHFVVKCYDLKSAYKQRALAPSTEPCAVT